MTAPYTSGTITLTNGSNIITGTGTGWATSLVVGGTVYPDANGNSLPIVSVDSDTKITAATKWRGATGTYSYAIMRDTAYGQQTVANAQALATYIQRLGSGLMAGLASLAPAANKVISFGDQSQAELLDLKTIGKNLLAAGDRASAYGALGEIPNAQLPTRIREQCTRVTASGALDNITAAGWVSVASGDVTTVNGPPAGGSGVCFTIPFDGNAAMQIYTRVTNATGENRQWIRNKAGGVWTAWVLIVSGDITNASSLISGDISDAILNTGLKTAGLLSAELLFSGYARLNTVSSTNYSKAQNGDNLVLTATGTDPQFAFTLNAPGNRARYLAFRIKRTAGSFENIVLYSTPSHNFSNSFRKLWTREVSGEWTTVVLDMWDLTTGGTDWKDSTINSVRVDFTNAAGGVIEVAWIGVFRDSPATYPQDTITDTRTGAPMIVGAFGLGGLGTLLTSADDLNSLPNTTAFYRMASGSLPANFPPPAQSCVMFNGAFNSGAASQVLFSVNSSLIWYRSQAGGVWNSWTRIDGDVSGPSTSVDNAPVAFSGTNGKVIKPLTGNVAALHAATGAAANTMPFFSGASTMSVVPLTPFARSLLDDPDAAAVWFTLGGGQMINGAGWQKLPSGLIIQWGYTDAGTGNFTRNFPMTFPNAAYTVHITTAHAEEQETNAFVTWGRVLSLSQFRVNGRYIINGGSVGAGGVGLCFIAFGR